MAAWFAVESPESIRHSAPAAQDEKVSASGIGKVLGHPLQALSLDDIRNAAHARLSMLRVAGDFDRQFVRAKGRCSSGSVIMTWRERAIRNVRALMGQTYM